MKTVKFFSCAGWQNVREYHERGVPFPVRVIEVPENHSWYSTVSYTEARDKNLDALIESLEEAAGIKGLKVKVEEQEQGFLQ